MAQPACEESPRRRDVDLVDERGQRCHLPAYITARSLAISSTVLSPAAWPSSAVTVDSAPAQDPIIDTASRTMRQASKRVPESAEKTVRDIPMKSFICSCKKFQIFAARFLPRAASRTSMS
jgi:hypothetical protein